MEPVKPPLIGKNIREIRKKSHLTLNVLSERCGVSKAMLSQIESEKVNPTVATIWKIAKGLDVDINMLLKGSSKSTRKFSVSRRENITVLDTDVEGLHLRVLSPLTMAEDLEIYILNFEPKAVLRSVQHAPLTEEFITVLKGRIRVTAGDASTDLRAGDFVMYHCDIDHTIENVSNSAAEIHMVVRFNKKQWG